MSHEQDQIISDHELEQRISDVAVSRVREDHELFLRVIEGKDLTEYITHKEALEILEYSPHTNHEEIASMITFENSNLVAQQIATSPNIDVARALYNELKYWADNGRI